MLCTLVVCCNTFGSGHTNNLLGILHCSLIIIQLEIHRISSRVMRLLIFNRNLKQRASGIESQQKTKLYSVLSQNTVLGGEHLAHVSLCCWRVSHPSSVNQQSHGNLAKSAIAVEVNVLGELVACRHWVEFCKAQRSQATFLQTPLEKTCWMLHISIFAPSRNVNEKPSEFMQRFRCTLLGQYLHAVWGHSLLLQNVEIMHFRWS